MSIRNVIILIMFSTLYAGAATHRPNKYVIDEVIDIVESRDVAHLKKISNTSAISTKASSFKLFELERTKASARRILSILPPVDTSSGYVKSYNFDTDNIFGDLLKLVDANPIDRVSEGSIYLFVQMDVPDLLAEAAIQFPDGMDAYISYSFIAEKEPEGEYAFKMRKVCRARYKDFIKSYNKMSDAYKTHFDRNIFNIKSCQLPNFQ